MASLSKKHVFLGLLAAGFLVVLIAVFRVPASVPHPLQVSLVGQTNNPSGVPMALVRVTNHTGQARWFYFVATVPTTNGWWTTANGWVARQKPLWHRLAAHAECQVLLRTPEGAAKWKFRCGSEPEVRKPEGLWYRFVRRTGLNRVGFRDQPLRTYVMTAEMSR